MFSSVVHCWAKGPGYSLAVPQQWHSVINACLGSTQPSSTHRGEAEGVFAFIGTISHPSHWVGSPSPLALIY